METQKSNPELQGDGFLDEALSNILNSEEKLLWGAYAGTWVMETNYLVVKQGKVMSTVIFCDSKNRNAVKLLLKHRVDFIDLRRKDDIVRVKILNKSQDQFLAAMEELSNIGLLTENDYMEKCRSGMRKILRLTGENIVKENPRSILLAELDFLDVLMGEFMDRGGVNLGFQMKTDKSESN